MRKPFSDEYGDSFYCKEDVSAICARCGGEKRKVLISTRYGATYYWKYDLPKKICKEHVWKAGSHKDIIISKKNPRGV